MYKKIISYIYDYEKGEKGENVGFVKLAIQNTRYKMKVHIRNSIMGEGEVFVYGFVDGEREFDGILLGKMNIANGTGDGFFQGSIEDLNLKQGFLDVHGLLFLGSKERYCVTQWDDEPFCIEGFRTNLLANQEDRNEEHEREIKKENNFETKNEIMLGNMPKEEKNKVPDLLYLNEKNQDNISKENEIQNVNPNEEKIQNRSLINQENTLQAVQVQECIRELEKEEEDIWEVFAKRQQEILAQYKRLKMHESKEPKTWRAGEQILESYPKMCPFFENQVLNSVRIEPKDIGTFPMEYWHLASNSFLLHGYYCYRHLLFIKRQGEKGIVYAIGIPGNNIAREKFMANMFGFTDFMSVKEKEKAGFGYWWKTIWRE